MTQVVRHLSMMKTLLGFTLSMLIVSSSSAIRGEWYESYKEDLVPKHVPVEAPRIPKVHGVSRGEWHVSYSPVSNRNQRNTNFLNPASEFVRRIRSEIRKRVDPIRRILRVKRNAQEYNSDYSYPQYDQYSVESKDQSLYASRNEEEAPKFTILDKFRDNLNQMMENVRNFFSPNQEFLEQDGTNNLDRENHLENQDSFHSNAHQQQQQGNFVQSQPTIFDRMRRDLNSMVGRVMSFFNRSPSQHNQASSQENQDEFYDFNQEFAHSSSPYDNSHERNYGLSHYSEDSSPGNPFFDGIKNSFKWIGDSLVGKDAGTYPGAPLPPESYQFEPTERRFGGSPSYSSKAHVVIPPK